jgi:glycosyltransferase involved in cell wall biosynthesis
LPAWNAGLTVERALKSIQRQSFADWELVAVDDGSTDGTGQILAEFAALDARVRLISRPHAGIVSALNSGLEHARGQFIARMDADDESDPERLSEQLELIQANPTLGLVGSLVRFGGNSAAAPGYALHVEWMNAILTPGQISAQRFVESPFAHPSVLFRRELLSRHGGYREGDFPEDYELWLRWLDAGVQMAKVPKVLLTWHDPSNRLSRQDPRYRFEAFYRCKAIYLARWLAREVDPARPVLVWGAGRVTRRRASYLTAHGVRIAGYIDIDPRKIGRALSGHQVLSPEQLPPHSNCFVLGYVAKRGAHSLAKGHLQARGFVEGRDFLMSA